MFSGNVDNCFWTHIGLRGDRLMPRSGSSTTGSKGQSTVPLQIRKRLGLKPGDRVEFIVDHGRAMIRPTRAPENPG
jgi:AbrB family looped-hinge helix DNA binding protein